MQNKFYICLVTVFCLLLSLFVSSTFAGTDAQDSSKKIKVFILAGQSNMYGINNINDIKSAKGYKVYLENPLKDAINKIPFYVNGGTRYPPSVVKYENENPIKRDIVYAYTSKIGPEVSFAESLLKTYKPDEILIIKFSVGGSSLTRDWRPAPNGDGIYKKMIENLKNVLGGLGNNYEIAGMCWMQGESDADTAELANEYKNSLGNLFTNVRKDLANGQLFPIVIGKTQKYDTSKRDLGNFAGIVRQAQEDICKSIKSAVAIETEDIPIYSLQGDPDFNWRGHLSTDGQITLGKRFAAAIKSLSSRKSLIGSALERSSDPNEPTSSDYVKEMTVGSISDDSPVFKTNSKSTDTAAPVNPDTIAPGNDDTIALGNPDTNAAFNHYYQSPVNPNTKAPGYAQTISPVAPDTKAPVSPDMFKLNSSSKSNFEERFKRLNQFFDNIMQMFK